MKVTLRKLIPFPTKIKQREAIVRRQQKQLDVKRAELRRFKRMASNAYLKRKLVQMETRLVEREASLAESEKKLAEMREFYRDAERHAKDMDPDSPSPSYHVNDTFFKEEVPNAHYRR